MSAFNDINSTFNVPDFRNKTTFGSGSLTVGNNTLGSLPNITGNFGKCVFYICDKYQTGALNYKEVSGSRSSAGQGGGSLTEIQIDASNSSSVYQSTTYVTPASVIVNYIIKF